MNFDKVIDKATAIKLIEPYFIGDKITSLSEQLHIDVMSKEYGQDEDWVGLTWEDYTTIFEDEYKTFELWYPEKAGL